MQISTALLVKISPAGAKFKANMNSVVMAVNDYGPRFGIDQPHRLAHFLAQLAHESGDFRYDKEIASGAAYEGRKDLGNTKRGDGKKFKGRTEMQVTGRGGYRRFTAWVRQFIPDAPDFEEEPERINEDPYEGLGAVWFWATHNLNRLADQNDIEMITVTINGGHNGFEDRKNKYDRAALAILGEPLAGNYIMAFQKEEGLEHVDGISGPRTRAALHRRLVMMTEKRDRASTVAAAPVVAKEAVPVKVASLEGSTALSAEAVTGYLFGGGGISTILTAFSGADWKIVAILAGTGMTGVIGFMIYRRWSAKQSQAAQVAEINARSAL